MTTPPPLRLAAAGAAAGGVLAQMAFPFTDGGTLALTTASVVLLAAAALLDAAATRGLRTAGTLLVVAGGLGLLVEAVGTRTGYPFGAYDYTGTLGAELLGVPVLVPLAWVMMAWPALAVGRRLGSRPGPLAGVLVVLAGAWALTSWDVFLDPQMVDQGHWRWSSPTPALPGVEGIPLTNFAGWLLVSLVMIAVLDRLVPDRPAADRPAADSGAAWPVDAVPLAVYLWTYFSSVLAHAAFFGRPPVALVGGLVMGAVAIPLVVRLVRDARRPRRRAALVEDPR